MKNQKNNYSFAIILGLLNLFLFIACHVKDEQANKCNNNDTINSINNADTASKLQHTLRPAIDPNINKIIDVSDYEGIVEYIDPTHADYIYSINVDSNKLVVKSTALNDSVIEGYCLPDVLILRQSLTFIHGKDTVSIDNFPITKRKVQTHNNKTVSVSDVYFDHIQIAILPMLNNKVVYYLNGSQGNACPDIRAVYAMDGTLLCFSHSDEIGRSITKRGTFFRSESCYLRSYKAIFKEQYWALPHGF
jgi:hypothetical protein